MWRRWASRNSSPESLVRQKRRIAFITRGISASASSIDIFDSSAPSAIALLGHPLEQQRRLRDRRDVARAVLGVGHDVGAEPVQRALAQRPLRDRQQVREPPLEEQVLDRRRHDLVQREVDERAGAGLAGLVHAGEPADARHQRAEREVLATPGADGLVGRPGDAEHAGHGPGDEVAGLPAGARTGAPERRQRHLDEAGVGRREVVVVDAELGEEPGRRGVDHEVGGLGEPAVGGDALGGPQVDVDGVLAAFGPPVEEAAARREPGVAHRRTRRRASDAGHRGAALGEDLAGEAPQLPAHLDHPQTAERPPCRAHHRHCPLRTATRTRAHHGKPGAGVTEFRLGSCRRRPTLRPCRDACRPRRRACPAWSLPSSATSPRALTRGRHQSASPGHAHEREEGTDVTPRPPRCRAPARHLRAQRPVRRRPAAVAARRHHRARRARALRRRARTGPRLPPRPHPPARQARALRALRPLGPLPRRHVPADGGRQRGGRAAADAVPAPHPRLRDRAPVSRRPAVPAGRGRRAVPVRALRASSAASTGSAR